jgi:hypothetical protein
MESGEGRARSENTRIRKARDLAELHLRKAFWEWRIA